MVMLKSIRLLIGGCLLALAPLAQAVMCQEAWKDGTKPGADYAIAVKAVEREDWTSAVAALEKIIERRAWDDDAHTLLGFAYRKLGKYQDSLEHYHLALKLNPYHVGAMEYLGEAYLAFGAHERARETLERLAAACQRISQRRNTDTWRQQCTEWRELNGAIQATRAQTTIEHIGAVDPGVRRRR